MKTTWLLLLLISPFILFAQDFKGKATGKERVETSSAAFEKEVLELVNKERKKRNLSPLTLKNELIYAARYHAKDMAVDNYLDHDSKDKLKNGSYKKLCDVFERMEKFVGKAFSVRSENIAAGQESPKEVMKVWMGSSGHRQNILDKKAKYIGIAYIYTTTGNTYEHYWVQDFGM